MEVNVVTAPEHRYFPPRSLKIFLAGGICKCIEWQKMILEYFGCDENKVDVEKIELSSDYSSLYLLNPRRADWLDKPGEAIRQIEWEFDMLEKCDMFTMYFAGGESDQPICMYELGRNIERMKHRFPESWMNRIVITCDSSYKRVQDVLVQTRLATDGLVDVTVEKTSEISVKAHYDNIVSKLKYIYNN